MLTHTRIRGAFLVAVIGAVGCSMHGKPPVEPARPKRWVAFDGSAPGTPAETRFDAGASDPQRSTIDVVIHGFYLEERKGPDGKYSKVSVPGLGSVGQIGAPSLPAVRMELAIVTGAERADVQVERSAPKTFPGVNVWPEPYPELDSRVGGTPERFEKNARIYELRTSWPEAPARVPHPARLKLPSIKGVTVEIFPVRWNPSTKELSVETSARYVVWHRGETKRQHAITQDSAWLASKKFANWDAVKANVPYNRVHFESDFLFIYPPGYEAALAPLVAQKKARGYVTTEMTTEQTGTKCPSIRKAIKDWHDGRLSWWDKYVLLVGDVDVIPLCDSPTGVPTDDLYASTDGDNLDREVYLGRLSVDTTTDASNQIAKILRYSDDPDQFFDYGRTLLAAHQEGAPGKYEGAQESVRTASYSVHPSFSTAYGSQSGVKNDDVSNTVNGGIGLAAYRGHGSETEWWQWNMVPESFDNADAMALSNAITRAPVVWSFACRNNAIGTDDAIGEQWLEDATSGAVSHYGATVDSGTLANHVLDREMFKAVFDDGLTHQSQAIYQAETTTVATESGNEWMYILLGDPEMIIRRAAEKKIKIIPPNFVGRCRTPGCMVEFSVKDDLGRPLRNVLVSAWKPGARAARDEVFANRYTDDAGKVALPQNVTTPGDLVVTARDVEGHVTSQRVPIR
jgi:hypothetical protein